MNNKTKTYIGASIGVAATVAAIGLAVGVNKSPTPTISTTIPQRLNAAGASFPAPIYERWFKDYAQGGGHLVNYQAIGSGAGVRQYIAKTVDFGASDGAVSDEKIPEFGMVHIPLTAGAIVPAYNNVGCDVMMTQNHLADVFLGKITNWNFFGCKDKPIVVVHRSDGSGTTKGFTNSLSAFSSEWEEKVGTGKSVNWPTGVGAKGNSGVAARIKLTDGAIGYLNYGYVNGNQFQQVAIENGRGFFVTANAETSAAGISRIKLDDQLRGADPNPDGENSYPIVSLTWGLAYPESPNNAAVKDVFRYMLSDKAQSLSDDLGYVPLPDEVRERALAAVDSLN